MFCDVYSMKKKLFKDDGRTIYWLIKSFFESRIKTGIINQGQGNRQKRGNRSTK